MPRISPETSATCSLCGEPMPEGEQMFNYHGFSGPCPKPPLPKPITTEQLDKLQFGKELHERPRADNRAQLAYETFLAGFNPPSTLPKWHDAPSWVRDVAQVAYLQGKLDAGPAQDAVRAAAERVCWFDWSDNDMDAVAAIDALRKAITSSVPSTAQREPMAWCEKCSDWHYPADECPIPSKQGNTP